MNAYKPRKADDTRRAALQALEDFKLKETVRREEREFREKEKEKKKRMWIACKWIVLIVCTGVIVFQVPRLISAIKKVEKPLRHGTYDTDERTDRCITNLWELAALLQRNKQADESILSPASNKPYVITESKGDVIVSAPDPELYGFRTIRASKKNPVPELIK